METSTDITSLGIKEALIGEGADNKVVLSTEPGICFRIPKVWDEEKVKTEKQIHDKLDQAGFQNIIPLYEPDYENKRVRMSDLSNGGENIVYSSPDRISIGREIATSNSTVDSFSKLGSFRIIPNIESFFDQLRQTVRLADKENIFIEPTNMMFVIDPDGNIQTIIGDYDGIEFNRERHQNQHSDPYVLYLKFVVLKIFPQLEKQADKFITELYPLSQSK